MHEKLFEFVGTLETVSFNLTTAAVFIPHHINIALPKGQYKVQGLINGFPFSLALQYRKDSGRYISVSSALRNAARVGPGDSVEVVFRLIHPERVDLPNPQEKLAPHVAVRSYIKTGSPSLESYVAAASTIDVRMRNALQIIKKGKAFKKEDQKRGTKTWKKDKK